MTTSQAIEKPSVSDLRRRTRDLRKDILEMIAAANSGHPGGSLSAIDLILTLYTSVLRHDPKRPEWEDRDRFILSKGHACPALYSTLAHLGYFDRALLPTFRQLGSPLQGHPELGRVAGAEASTGSLGQGLSIGLGVALAARVLAKDYRTYVMVGDGETNEGQVWEAAASAGFHRVDNMVAIVDYNRIQLDGFAKDILDMEPMADKWRAFNWHVIEIDGHDFEQIRRSFDEAKATKGLPTVIVANTVKGKGVSFMENNPDFHGTPPTKEQLVQALAELAAQEV